MGVGALARLINILFGSLSVAGVVLAFVFFCASLTPSLMPRSALVQGALSGLAAGVGYLIGVILESLWLYLELPTRPAIRRRFVAIVTAVGLVAAIASLWHAAAWQNSIRELWTMPALESVDPLRLVAIALAVFVVLFLLGRLFLALFRIFASRAARILPRRISILIGLAAALLIFWSVGEGLLLRGALRLADSSFRQMDALLEDEIAAPSDPSKTGSSASLLDWHGLGRQGRHFIASGPGRAELETFWGTAAMEPIRVYAGLNSAETIEERAKLALDELIRQGGFERSTLVVITPTGTGWIDPEAVDTLDYLHRGDVASIALQYSYLTSWLSLLVEPEYGSESARVLFRTVYRYWGALPKETRPKLILYGLSLGALNSQQSADLMEVIADPFQGALWAGPPFQSKMWNDVTASRNPGSPAWLPAFRDSSIIRFTNQDQHLDIPGAHWGPLRIVYLQYATDAVTFFDPWSFYRSPPWLQGERGPDVSPALRWYPALTMLQLLFDMMIATTSPMGHGHVYAPQHYIDPWIAVTGLDIEPATVERLKRHFIEVQ
ncbi:alpha/beta hydrolase [Rhizobium daejeonense]|uniref:alpha/beta hydrolase n=1 Tax=Rhizobium daejeonense TaxID=240521 RepID=UPI001FCEA05D|nr:alpha/beta-hydrolase family protein [Rhizobium daejeonense]